VTGARGIPVGYGTLVLVYLGLAGIVVWLLRRFSRVPLGKEDTEAVPLERGASRA
jgi:cytochrome d ubiquinol oxidase subunit I